MAATTRKTCTWPSFRDKHRRRRFVSLSSRWTRLRRPGRTPITPAAINEGEWLYNQRADIYRGANAHSAPGAAWIIIRFYCRLTRRARSKSASADGTYAKESGGYRGLCPIVGRFADGKIALEIALCSRRSNDRSKFYRDENHLIARITRRISSSPKVYNAEDQSTWVELFFDSYACTCKHLKTTTFL